jgi:hypothetical protein
MSEHDQLIPPFLTPEEEAEAEAAWARADEEFERTNPVAVKFASAFEALRADGFFVGFRWQCCLSCGTAHRPEDEKAKPFVFFHEQDWDALKETGKCWIAWDMDYYSRERGDPGQILRRLEEAGLAIEHDGRDGKRICVRDRVAEQVAA